jgi:ABC-2 type transport system ATP-binding protein
MNGVNAIEVRNLQKGYKGVPVLHDVSFTVERGKVFALLGANGSGKTTTINILTTLSKADGGRPGSPASMLRPNRPRCGSRSA